MVGSMDANKSVNPGLLVIFIIAISTVFSTGCIDDGSLSTFSGDPVVKRVQPYTSQIVFNDISLRKQAATIVKDCPSGDKECQVAKIYRYVVENYSYYSDPRNAEFIQSPYDTIDVQGGDCEDLTILLMSLLENLGIKTYFVITEDHAYCLVYDVDIENLMQYIEEPILRQVSQDMGQNGNMDVVLEGGKLYIVEQKKQTFTLKPGYLFYYGGNGSGFSSPVEYMDIKYNLSSSQPLTTYVVPSRADYELMSRDRSFNYFPSCTNQNVVWIRDACPSLSTHGGLVIKNDNKNDAIIDMDLKFYYYYSPVELFRDQQISFYEIDGKKSIVLDATAGKYGYPGYDANLEGEKIAVDPLTKEYIYLN
ncbi:MAG: transglutaminase-like domain-containing protein [Methanosarcinales archaeon]|nr:transglutaminase-like domain-containing protein [ANME-2 cluster archaeon]MDF1530861.1 transglutaminase-like domain-containing protein [ANME-2 cluster archaeon]MDW7776167.1 transglutaminase-like domain-containing protein [Methanosarcinales archaeon]